MRNDTRKLYAALLAQIAALNGVEAATQKFTVSPSVQQTLETKIQESSDFLSKINMIGVAEQSGDKLGLGVGGPIASTTNTAGGGTRQTSDLTTLDESGYFCTQTNFDSHLSYAKLDAWAKFPDFQTRVRDALIRRQALDRIMIGFNGTSRAATSDKVANPLLQDVNKGWLQKYREFAPARVLSEVAAASGKIQIGDGVAAAAGYKNLDALVMDIVNAMIEPWYQEDTELVVIMGRSLLADKYFPLVNKVQDNSEKIAADMIISQKRVGGLPAVQVPFVPNDTLIVTRLDNLSIYWQEGTRRRHIKEVPERDRIEDFQSSNEAYVVEDYGCGCVAENIELV